MTQVSDFGRLQTVSLWRNGLMGLPAHRHAHPTARRATSAADALPWRWAPSIAQPTPTLPSGAVIEPSSAGPATFEREEVSSRARR